MKFKMIEKLSLFAAVITLSACTQYTPSMLNKSQVQLSRSTLMEQIALENINENVLSALASHHAKNGTSDVDLTMTYDPASKEFTAMNAVHELGHIKQYLKSKGVHNMTSQTMGVPNGHPSLMVSYDVVQALAPNDCHLMPGLNKENTTRFLGQYQFGCSTETMFAKQIAHPADWEGNGKLGARDGRREAIILDGYGRGEPRVPIEGVERGDLVTK